MSIAEHLLTLGESLSDILNDCNDALVEKGVSMAGNLRGVADLIRQISIGSGGGSGGSGSGDGEYEYEYYFIGTGDPQLRFYGKMGGNAGEGDEWLVHIEADGVPVIPAGQARDIIFYEGDFVVRFHEVGASNVIMGKFVSCFNIKVIDIDGNIVDGDVTLKADESCGWLAPSNGSGGYGGGLGIAFVDTDPVFAYQHDYKMQIQMEYTSDSNDDGGNSGGEDVGGDTGDDNTGSGDNTGDNGDTPLTEYDYSGTVTVSNKTTLDLNISGLSDINVNGIYLELEGAGDDYVVTKIENGAVEYQYQDEITDGGNLSATLNRGMQGNEDLGITISANIAGSSEELKFDGTYTWGYTT